MTSLAISFHGTRMSSVRALWEERRARPSVSRYNLDAMPMMRWGCEPYSGGTFVVYDWEAGQVVWQVDIDGATGFCWHERFLYVNMLRLGDILVLDGQGREQYRLSNRLLNNLHTIVPTRSGFLISSTGVDSIFEIDRVGNIIYEWCALDQGFDHTVDGRVRALDRTQDHRYIEYPTPAHTTHVNGARFAAADEQTILATLFHQGTIIAIDRRSGRSRILVDGLLAPHDLRPHPHGGWVVSDTRRNQVLLFDEDWRVERRIAHDFNWVQSAAPLNDGSVIVADANHNRLVRVYPGNEPTEIRIFPPDWRIYLIEEVPLDLADFFR